MEARLCIDAIYQNLWMVVDKWSNRIVDVPRYVTKDSQVKVLGGKSAYDHVIQCGGRFYTYNALPFVWKISPYVYHTTGLVVSG